MNKADYLNKMTTILSDTSRFNEIPSSQDIYKINIKTKDRINYQLRKLKEKNSISQEEYNDLYISGSSPPILYGQPKVHKDNILMRPILAAFNAASYKLAKFLIGFLQRFTTNQYTLKNSYEFKESLGQLNLPPNVTMATFT